MLPVLLLRRRFELVTQRAGPPKVSKRFVPHTALEDHEGHRAMLELLDRMPRPQLGGGRRHHPALALLFACGEESATLSGPVEPPPAAPEPEVPETPAGPAGHAVTAHCGRMDPPVTVGQSRVVEVVIRERTSRTTATHTIETGVIGWLCLFDRFGPGEERVARGPIQDFARDIVRANPDPALCERALATPLTASDAARDAAVAVRFEVRDRIFRNEPGSLSRAIDEILVDCGFRRRSVTP